MRTAWLIIVLILTSLVAGAQNNFFFGHYMMNPSYFNPGWTGGVDQAFVTFQHRSQWLGYTSSFDGPGGAPSTQMITTIVPFQNFPLSSIGLNVSNDDLGPVNIFQIQLPVSVSKEFRRSRISIGVAPVILSQTQQFDALRFNDPTDPLNSGSNISQTLPDLSVGVLYRTNGGFFVGASALNILQPSFDFGLDSLENVREISYALHGGTEFNVTDQMIVRPTFLVRSDLNGFTFDLGAIATLREKMWAGISYRRQESAILYLGYSLLANNRLQVGYSFDYVFQNQDGKAPTSHELFVQYDLPDLVFGGRKAVKTPRFSY